MNRVAATPPGASEAGEAEAIAEAPMGAVDTAGPVAAEAEFVGLGARRTGGAGRSVSDKASFWTLTISHVVVDTYPIFFASLMLVLKARLGLEAWQIALIYATGPVVSGLPQVFWAWFTDKLDTRLCGWFGLALGAACICSIGLAESFWQLWALQAVGMMGTGMYHPIGAALAGQLGGRIMPSGRAWGVSIFYTAGMIGGFSGAILCTRLTAAAGMTSLLWLLPPAMVASVALFAATHRLGHRHSNHRELHAAISPGEARERWWTIGLLFAQNVLRFTVNTGLPVLFVIWAESRIQNDVTRATNLNGNLLAAMTVGMGAFGLMAQHVSPPGREKRPMFVLTLLGAVFVAVTGFAGTHVGIWAMYALAALSAIGFSAVVPTTIAVAQRLLPGRTGLASGLMLGTAWSVSALAPLLAGWFLGGAKIDVAHELAHWKIDLAFVGFAGLLVLAAMLTAVMPSGLLRKVAEHR